MRKNYIEKLESLHGTLASWSHLKLTLLGKIAIIKSLALPKLTYYISTMPTPEWFTIAAQNAIKIHHTLTL